MFELKNINYKNIISIDNMLIPKEKVTCIIGKSGSGKTTFLKLLNRMVTPDKGTIYYEGKDINNLDPVSLRREVIMMPQNPVVFEGNIKNNLLKGLFFSEKPLLGDDHLKKILEYVKLDKNLEDATHNLSGGERQRLAIGRILAMDPKVLLLDEPSSALDEITEEAVIEMIINEVKISEKTLIMVTHSKKVADNFGDNIIEF